MDNGYWIKVYRKIRESAIWNNNEPFDYRSAWIDLIMEANVKPNTFIYKGQTITVKRGEYYTSVRKLSNRWHWSKDKVNRFLKILIKLDMVRKHNEVKCATLLTIVKYDDFQSRTDSNKDRHKDAHKDSDKDRDESLYKKDKERKEIKKDAAQHSDEVAASEKSEGRVEVIPGYTQEELDENFIDGFIPMTEEEWNALPEG